MGGTLLTIFWFLVVLTPLVFVHEFGHYWVARRNGVRGQRGGAGGKPPPDLCRPVRIFPVLGNSVHLDRDRRIDHRRGNFLHRPHRSAQTVIGVGRGILVDTYPSRSTFAKASADTPSSNDLQVARHPKLEERRVVPAPGLEPGRPFGQRILSLSCIILYVPENMSFLLYRKIVHQCFHHFVLVLVRTCSYYIDDPRAGRWANHSKTECGIHLKY